MFLATTALTEFWDKQDELLLLGSWCLRPDREAEWASLRFRVFRNLWDDRGRLEAAYRYCQETVGAVLDELPEQLNAVHGTRLSRRYWSVLVGPWLVQYTHAFYDRYVHLQAALAEHPDVRTTGLDPKSYVAPLDGPEFCALYLEDFYNLQLYSQILGCLGRSFPVRALDRPVLHAGTRGLKGRAKGSLKSLARSAIGRFKADVLFHDPILDRPAVWMLAKGTGFKALPYVDDSSSAPRVTRVDSALRGRLRERKASDEFGRLLRSSLPENLPMIFLENFEEARKRASRRAAVRPKAILGSSNWYHDEPFKFFAAECAEQGTRLLGAQHGGGYGFWKLSGDEMEIRNMDRWFAWGWASAASDPRVVDLPSPHLSRLEAGIPRRAGLTDLLLASTACSRYCHWLLSIPMTSQFDLYLEWRARFIRQLPGSLRKDCLVRLQPRDFGWNERKRLEEEFLGIRIDDGRTKFLKRLEKARVAVFDNPITTFLESFAANVPSILFWNPEHWECREEAAPYANRLVEAGILFHSPEAAARKLQEIHDDPASWWLSGPVQSARREFVGRFALARPDWLAAWTAQLKKEAELAS